MYGTKMMCYSPEAQIDEAKLQRTPAVDIIESEKDFVLHVNMPGVKKENVKVQVEDGQLIISGAIENGASDNSKFVLREIRPGSFYRQFKLSDTLATDSVEATYENGVLSIVLHKKPETQPRAIEIK